MPKTQRAKLRLHRETVRRLDAAPTRIATDPVALPGDTVLCGPSRMETGCETTA